MGNTPSVLQNHLYVLKVTNNSLPICPFLHTIIKYNGTPIQDTDPRIFKEILSKLDLTLEIMDLRDKSIFTVCIPKGTEKLGLNVIKIKGEICLMKMRVNTVREHCPFKMNDQILGIENLYSENEEELIKNIKEQEGKSARIVIIRDGQVVVQETPISKDLGCEVGTGLFFKVDDETEYFMENYNGELKKMNSTKTHSSPMKENVGALVDDKATKEESNPDKKVEGNVNNISYDQKLFEEQNNAMERNLTGKMDDTQETAFVLNNGFANSQSFIEELNGLSMKADAFEQRKNLIEISQGLEKPSLELKEEEGSLQQMLGEDNQEAVKFDCTNESETNIKNSESNQNVGFRFQEHPTGVIDNIESSVSENRSLESSMIKSLFENNLEDESSFLETAEKNIPDDQALLPNTTYVEHEDTNIAPQEKNESENQLKNEIVKNFDGPEECNTLNITKEGESIKELFKDSEEDDDLFFVNDGNKADKLDDAYIGETLKEMKVKDLYNKGSEKSASATAFNEDKKEDLPEETHLFEN